MSSPPNPLDVFRTYAYHHILIACDSSTTAEELAEVSEISQFDHPEDRFCPRQTSGGGNYVVLINGLTDVQFFIQDAKWSSVLIPKSGGSGQASITSTMAVDGGMTIVEPRGVNLFNIFNQVTKMLRIDPSAMIYVLKTIFVGTTDYGVSETITTIRPLPFILTDITAQFDNTGATYELSFVGMVNGAGKMPYCNSIVQGYTGEIQKGSTLGKAMADTQFKINDLYAQQKRKAIDAASFCTDGNSDPVDFSQEFMDVEYEIHLDPAYSTYPAGDTGSSVEASEGEDGKHVADFGDGASIESLLTTIMMTSSRVIEDQEGEATDSVDTTKRFMFKIVSSVEVTRETDKRTYKVKYFIHRYAGTVIPAEKLEEWSPNGATPDNDPNAVGITFDYIFSGQNTDIIEFDLDMQYGLTFMQMLGSCTSAPVSSHDRLRFDNPDTYVSGVGNLGGPGDQKPPSAYCGEGGDGKVKKPLFLGSMVSHPAFRDTRLPGKTATYNSLLHRIAAMENIGARFKIRGNPQLLEDTTQQPQDIDFSGAAAVIADNSERAVFPRGHQIPGFVKVNIWMPNEWQLRENDAADAVSRAAGDYAQQFWYKGWYMLLQIDHEFSDGEFTQELEIYSLPTDAGQSQIGQCIDEAVYPPSQADQPVNTTSAAAPQSEETATATETPAPATASEPRQAEEKNTIADTQARRTTYAKRQRRRRNR